MNFFIVGQDKMKGERTEFLRDQILQFGVANKKRFVITWRDKAALSNGNDVSSLSSIQEEVVDTKIILMQRI